MALFRKPTRSKADAAPRRRQAPSEERRAAEQDLEQRYAFRRNRTLTGSSSSFISSSSEQNAQLKSPRVHAHDLARLRRKLLAVFVVVVFGAIILYALVSQFTARAYVHTSELSVQLDSRYEKVVQDYFGHHPIERLRFALNQQSLQDYVTAALPEVESITPSGSTGLGESDFTVVMRRPVAGWNIGGNQEYVDGEGVSFGRNYYAVPSVQIVDNSGVQLAAGQAVASNSFLSFVGRVVGEAKNQGYIVTKVSIPEGTTREIAVTLKGVSYQVKFSVGRPVGAQIEDMARAIKWMASHKVHPKYIDVRVNGRAFYK